MGVHVGPCGFLFVFRPGRSNMINQVREQSNFKIVPANPGISAPTTTTELTTGDG